MPTIDSILESYESQSYEIKEIDFLPQIHNMSSNKSYKFTASIMNLAFRGAKTLLVSDWEPSLHVIHKIIIDVVSNIIADYDGTIVESNGNNILAVWSSDKSNINKSVEAALAINWVLNEKFNEITTQKIKFDYGIAISEGEIFAFKTRKPDGEYDDELINYVSPIISFTKALSSQLSTPNAVGISEEVYGRLYDDSKKVKKSFILIPYEKNIWNEDKLNLLKSNYKIRITNHSLNLESREISKN